MAKTGNIHVVIPDCQVKPGVPLDHLGWIRRFIQDEYAPAAKSGTAKVKVINLGDFWDLPSLSSYDKGKKAMEGRRVKEDIQVGNRALKMLRPTDVTWTDSLEWFILEGNHEHRLVRLGELDPQLDGILPPLDTEGWKVVPYQEILRLDGVAYSHFFYNDKTGRPHGGMMETRLKKLGRSFSQGHQQGMEAGQYQTLGGRIRGLVAGSCYLHNEIYRGPQARNEWRGVLVCHNVHDGDYDLMEVSLDYLARRYTGKPVSRWMA